MKLLKIEQSALRKAKRYDNCLHDMWEHGGYMTNVEAIALILRGAKVWAFDKVTRKERFFVGAEALELHRYYEERRKLGLTFSTWFYFYPTEEQKRGIR